MSCFSGLSWIFRIFLYSWISRMSRFSGFSYIFRLSWYSWISGMLHFWGFSWFSRFSWYPQVSQMSRFEFFVDFFGTLEYLVGCACVLIPSPTTPPPWLEPFPPGMCSDMLWQCGPMTPNVRPHFSNVSFYRKSQLSAPLRRPSARWACYADIQKFRSTLVQNWKMLFGVLVRL